MLIMKDIQVQISTEAKTEVLKSIETLKTVATFINSNNGAAGHRVKPLIDAVNRLAKAELMYTESVTTKASDEDMDLYRSNLQTSKLELITLISTL